MGSNSPLASIRRCKEGLDKLSSRFVGHVKEVQEELQSIQRNNENLRTEQAYLAQSSRQVEEALRSNGHGLNLKLQACTSRLAELENGRAYSTPDSRIATVETRLEDLCARAGMLESTLEGTITKLHSRLENAFARTATLADRLDDVDGQLADAPKSFADPRIVYQR
jgi:chromosome segregation ATPase